MKTVAGSARTGHQRSSRTVRLASLFTVIVTTASAGSDLSAVVVATTDHVQR